MSETALEFNEGDIVWVKLGPSWWPGEVKDPNNLPSDVVSFKKPPLYIVKFFDEDSYEYVKTPQNIHPYNCERKNDFIKKGMASFRAKLVHMQKFPKDVCTAEVKTGGNPNILSEPIFLPEKKINYAAEIFGTPSPKKKLKEGDRKKGRFSISKKDSTPNITHRRFLGSDDYEAQICIQYPGKDICGDTEECEEIIRINKEPAQEYKCQKCGYATTRLEVMILHTKSHIQGVYDSTLSSKKSRKSVVRKPRQKKKTFDELLLEDDSDLDMPASKRKPKSQTSSRKAKQKKSEENKNDSVAEPVSPTHIRNNLLAEWEESDEEEEDEDSDKPIDKNVEEKNDKDEEQENTEDLSKNDDEKEKTQNGDASPSKTKEDRQNEIKKDIKSCFDFDDDEEDTPIVETAVGRKIPRVIPPSEKRKSEDFQFKPKTTKDSLEKSNIVEEDIDDEKKEETLKVSQSFNVIESEEPEKEEDHEKTFKELLESTSVPTLPDVQNTLKAEQNFHDTKTIKFPDKTEPTESEKKSSEVATKLTNPKKRFVKSFEDFEMLQNEQRRLEEEEEERSHQPEEKAQHVEEKSEEHQKPHDFLEEKPVEDVKISKLRNKMMTKIMSEERPTRQSTRRSSENTSQTSTRKSLEKQIFTKKEDKIEDEIEAEIEDKIEAEIEEDISRKKDAIAERLGVKRETRSRFSELKKVEEQKNVEEREEKKALEKESCPPKKKFCSRRSSKRQSVNEQKAAEINSDEGNIKAEEISQNHASSPKSPAGESPEQKAVEEGNIKLEEISQTDVSSPAEESAEQKAAEIITDEDNFKEVQENVDEREQKKALEKESCPPKKKFCSRRSSKRQSVNEQKAAEKNADEDNFKAEEISQNDASSPKSPCEESLEQKAAEEDNIKLEEISQNDASSPKRSAEEIPTRPEKDQVLDEKDVQEIPTRPEKDQVLDEKDVQEKNISDISSNIEIALNKSEELRNSSKSDLDLIVASECNNSKSDLNRDKIELSLEKSEDLNSKSPTKQNDSPEKNRNHLPSPRKESSSPTKITAAPIKDTFLSKKEDVYSITETSAVLPDDAICSPIKKSPIKQKQEEENLEAKEDSIKVEAQQEKELNENSTKVNVLEFSFEDAELDKSTTDKDLNELVDKPAEETKNVAEAEDNPVKTDEEEVIESVEMSALSTLASLATATTESLQEKPDKIDHMVIPAASETVHIDESSLTVVSEKDLADGQVEITSSSEHSTKPPVTLMNFSMDFTESETENSSELHKIIENQISKSPTKSASEEGSRDKSVKKYERLELLDILEGNSLTPEQKAKDIRSAPSFPNEILDFEEHIPSQIVRATTNQTNDAVIDVPKPETFKCTSKLMARLTEAKKKREPEVYKGKIKKANLSVATKSLGPKTTLSETTEKSTPSKSSSNKPIILSEKIIKPANTVPMKKPLKRTFEDIEDVEAPFFIAKSSKKSVESNEVNKGAINKGGKAKILQQTIITPAGQVIQPKLSQMQTDDNVFDINNMPIVMSDDIFTPDNIESMPVVLEDKPNTTKNVLITNSIKKTVTQTRTTNPQLSPVIKSRAKPLIKQAPRILQNSTPRMIKQHQVLPSSAKPNSKYIIMPQSSNSGGSPQLTQIKTAKKSAVIKQTIQPGKTFSPVSRTQNVMQESTGNKIMIVTNQQGEQQRLLLTPAHQKLLGVPGGAAKITKPLIKNTYLQQKSGTVWTPNAGPSATKTIRGATKLMSSPSSQLSGQSISANMQPRTVNKTVIGNKIYVNKNQKTVRQKTILIKNQHGQTVRTIQGTDDELLDKQVAEQLEAIKAKASGALRFQQQQQAQKQHQNLKSTIKKTFSKRVNAIKDPKTSPAPKSDSVPPLTLISPKKNEPALQPEEKTAADTGDRAPNQLVIQDALGNQTTITEGQILALPSETVDGQPQSYMLVTLDESGNLTPLNSEALMSLDPNLLGGGDLSNMVLQIDQGGSETNHEGTIQTQTAVVSATATEKPTTKVSVQKESSKPAPVKYNSSVDVETTTTEVSKVAVDSANTLAVETSDTEALGAEGGQQLILTGDPIATQKFLESLTEGSTDLANILANAEGSSSIIIQADGQQILINTNSDNQMMLSLNSDNVESSETGNPMFNTQQSTKSQDILAAALADTDVFQPVQTTSRSKIHSQLSPGSTSLYPMNVGTVLETSLTLSTPIMTPLEVPSTNSKKIADEADILAQVPKNPALPITITDPNISQTVAQQQVLVANDLQANLELNLPISEAIISATSSEMSSPSFVYSLPTLDEINQKPFNSSMPLLTEDVEETTEVTSAKDINVKETTVPPVSEETITTEDETAKKDMMSTVDGFIEEEEGLCTLGGEMCSSLSEPPPDMFDLPSTTFLPANSKTDDHAENDSLVESNSPTTVTSEDSNEIPVQAEIVTELSLSSADSNSSLKRSSPEEEDGNQEKKCKFD
ncbi:unnamed protein product [Brassicogethes aeneus]|uniref:PWWP domain-containing protein n=1 Tax=Brassicogethes aeneus TaxID=1431903 RepID=A0A9P0FHG8_BRAAE|nr:unnamed protein product [Brassicogethes aeneus]